MPLYEFKCSQCNDIVELLIMHSDEAVALQCPRCRGENLERVLSAANYSTAGKGGAGLSAQTRQCSGGSCTTYDIPGPS